MLKELKIENLAIIEKVNLELEEGLIVLTGETGAGKSIILNGINLLIGEKANVEMIRDGEDTLVAEGIFKIDDEKKKELEELGIDIDDDEMIVRRQLDINGKGKVFINNQRVTISTLKKIMETFIDMVGQHSHQMLLNRGNYLKLLDKFLGDSGLNLKKELEESYHKYYSLKAKIEKIEEDRKNLIEKKEFYRFQLEEIQQAKLKKDEEQELEEEYKKLFYAGQIKERLTEIELLLKDGESNALSYIYNSKRNLEAISSYGKEYEENLEKLEKIYYELQDCVENIVDLNDDIESNDLKLEKIIARLDLIKKLKEKYGEEIENIIEYGEKIKEKLEILEDADFNIERLSEEKKQAEKNYYTLALKLQNLRKEKAKVIEDSLYKELMELNMGEGEFKIEFKENKKVSIEGIDDVEFLLAPNKGQGLKPLWKIASGGEISRIMLAIKVIFSKVDSIPILIFDEIDIGVGGETVRKIAEKLREVGEKAQVISITHSPAVAGKATQQFYIEKSLKNEKMVSKVRSLNKEERVMEIARMLAGKNISEVVLKHARELLDED